MPPDQARSTGRLILLGLRGSGKTTVGRLAADLARAVFIDLDDRTPARLGCDTAAEAIRTRGLDAFRRAESKALQEVLSDPARPLLLALGGGTPTAPGADDLLRRAADSGSHLVYLHADVDELRRRLEKTDPAARPGLTAAGTIDEVGEIYLRRDELYRQLATTIIETAGRTPPDLASRVAGLLD